MRRIQSAFAASIACLIVLSLAEFASGQIVFQDNFDSMLSGPNWTTSLSHPTLADASVDFAYNYANLGIPPAPRSNGTTIGMRFLVNQTTNTFQGISASPTGKMFTRTSCSASTHG